MIVVLDPGHGGRDPGAVGPTGLQEKEVTLDVALRVRTLLAPVATVGMVRTTDATVQPRSGRSRLANEMGANAFVSIHCNGFHRPGANGTETFHLQGAKLGARLATTIQTRLIKKLGRRNRGVKQRNFTVIRGAKVPVCLPELAFITNPEEEALLRTPAFREKAAQAIAEGVCEFIEMPRKEESKVEEIVFADVENHWARENIFWAFEKGLVAKDLRFRPDDNLTRAEAMTLLRRFHSLIINPNGKRR